MKTISLDQIITDAGTQARCAIDQDVVAEYAEAMTEGAKFPALVVFHDGSHYFCADGFHRIMAAQRCGFKDFPCDVQKGTADDATWYALGANRTHGKRLNRADVRAAIALALRKFAGKSNRDIAAQIGCSDHTVAAEREQLERGAQIAHLNKTTGKDGKAYPATRPATAREVCGEAEREAEVKERIGSRDPLDTTTDAGMEEQDDKDGESSTLYHLKRYWKMATKADKKRFIGWINEDNG